MARKKTFNVLRKRKKYELGKNTKEIVMETHTTQQHLSYREFHRGNTTKIHIDNTHTHLRAHHDKLVPKKKKERNQATKKQKMNTERKT